MVGRAKNGRNERNRKKRGAGRRSEAGSRTPARVLSGHGWRGHSDFRRRPESMEKRAGNKGSVGDDDARIGSVPRRKNCGGRFLRRPPLANCPVVALFYFIIAFKVPHVWKTCLVQCGKNGNHPESATLIIVLPA